MASQRFALGWYAVTRWGGGNPSIIVRFIEADPVGHAEGVEDQCE